MAGVFVMSYLGSVRETFLVRFKILSLLAGWCYLHKHDERYSISVLKIIQVDIPATWKLGIQFKPSVSRMTIQTQ